MNPILALRTVVGWTQRRLAVAAGTSQPTIAAYESGSKSPTWRTISSIAEGAGLACYAFVGSPMTREEARSMALHGAIVTELRRDPTRVADLGRANIARMRHANPNAAPLLDEWAHILAMPLNDGASRILDPSNHGRELRQLTPFAGVLDARQRAEVYRSFRHAA
jgi:transcriptional regulator with XRE-family HTH domain